MKISICTDHGGYALKQITHEFLIKIGYEILDFGAFKQDDGDDYPDFIVPLAKAVAGKDVQSRYCDLW